MRLVGRVGGALPGRKVLTLVHAIVAGGSHIDHADVLRSGATQAVLDHRVMAPSTLGTFLRAFTFGHVRQLEAVVGKVLERAWAQGGGPGDGRLVVDVDSTICEVAGPDKAGAAFGYTKVLGYHPLVATRAETGEVLHARMRKGSANTARGAKRFVEELIARVRRAGAAGEIVLRFDSGFWSNKTIEVLGRLNVRYTMAVRAKAPERVLTVWRERVLAPSAGVIDQDRHRAERRLGLDEHLRWRVGVDQVSLDGDGPSSDLLGCSDRGLGTLFPVRAVCRGSTGIVVVGSLCEVGDGDIRAEPGELNCGGSPDAVVGAGDDGYATAERKAGHGR